MSWRDPHVIRVLSIEIFPHRADLAVPELYEHVIFLPIEAPVLQVALRLDLNGDLVAFGDATIRESSSIPLRFIEATLAYQQPNVQQWTNSTVSETRISFNVGMKTN